MATKYTIKPLVWEHNSNAMAEWFRAYVIIGGCYEVVVCENIVSWSPPYDTVSHRVDSIESAKQAAWEHWVSRLESCLEPVKDGE